MTQYIAINDKIIPETEVYISPLNPGFLFGEGLFETIRADTGRPFLLPEHLKRMRNGLRTLGLALPADFDNTATIISDLLNINQLSQSNAVIKLICSPAVTEKPNLSQRSATCLIIKADDLDLSAIKIRQQGIRAQLLPWRRDCNNPLLSLKSLSYLENRYALQVAKQQGFTEGIFLNQNGELCEGTFSNLFLVRGDRLLTPPLTAGILPGTTRAFILEKAPMAGIEVCETPLFPDDLKTCNGAFLTSSLMHLAPLLELGQNRFALKETVALRKIMMDFFTPALQPTTCDPLTCLRD